MIKLQKIIIENFQSHEKTVLDLSEGLNIVIGTSDTGKSAVIRALRWVLENKPSGDSFISNWGGPAKVTLIFKDGTKIIREKSKSTNLYWMDDNKYEGFGQNVPEEIINYLSMSELNTSYQHDPPFLLTNSPGQVAAYLNKMVNLSLIDDCSRVAISEVRDRKRKLQSKEEELDKVEDELQEFKGLKKIGIKLEKVHKINNSIDDLNDDYNDLLDTINRYKKNLEEIEKYKNIDDMESRLIDLKKVVSNLNQLESYRSQIRSISRRTREAISILRGYADLDDLPAKLKNLDNICKGINDNNNSRKKISYTIERIDIEKGELEEVKKDLDEVKRSLDEFDYCPHCGSQLKGDD